MIQLSDLKISPLNPRKTLPENFGDLVESIKQKGVIQSLLVRADGKGYEIICGRCRFEAAQKAGLETVPCDIREISDEEVEEIMLVENLQRSDVHYIQEAEAFDKLLKRKTAAEIAASIGKSEAFVVQRTKLRSLAAPIKKLALNGLPITHALLLAPLAPEMQTQAAENCFDSDKKKGVEFGSMSALRQWIEQNVMLNLATAPFKLEDETLYKKAGSCVACPKRTGANTMLFADAPKGDQCLDRVCFSQKLGNHVHVTLESLKKTGEPLPVLISHQWNIDERQAKQFDQPVLTSGNYSIPKNNKDKCDSLTKGVVAIPQFGNVEEIGKIVTVCTNTKCKIHNPRITASAEQREKTKDDKFRKVVGRQAVKVAIREHGGKSQFMEPAALRYVVGRFLDTLGHDPRKEVCRASGWIEEEIKKNPKLKLTELNYGELASKRVAKMEEKELLAVLVACCLTPLAVFGNEDELKAGVKVLSGVSFADVEKEVRKSVKSKEKKTEEKK
jgi:ParB family chromosome partitioning protein